MEEVKVLVGDVEVKVVGEDVVEAVVEDAEDVEVAEVDALTIYTHNII
jgi:hypothetical protein